ncbi:cytochrome c maturation protein CcmE [Rhodopila sp.]|uniref:cytochrome c maturation protein CcmE n=1 Tax=Rhodopila sp. TaxID=2480087 RepID=UPI003D0D3F5E
MTRKRRRLILLLVCGVGLGGATALTLSAFSDNLVFFVSPSDLARENHGSHSVRLGGLVAQGSVERSSNGQPTARFKVTDGSASVEVTYRGILPDLFREGQGVVALGNMQPNGVFRASEVLAKHDESYMPKEVADALKKSGRWNPASGPPPPASTWTTSGNAAGNAPVTRSAQTGS